MTSAVHPTKYLRAMVRFRKQQIERIAVAAVYLAAIVVTLLDVFVWRSN